MADELVPRDDDDAVGDYLELGAIFAEAVPGLGAAISHVLGGFATERKIRRVREILNGVAVELKGFRSEVASEYVRTEDFEDLLEETLRQAARERSAEKRAIYRDFIVNAIREPGEPYDEQLKTLRLIERLSAEHIRVLAALAEPPPPTPTFYSGSPLAVLERRLGDMSEETIARLVDELDGFRLTDLFPSLRTLMTGQEAEQLTSRLTPLGERVLGLTKS